MTSFAIQSFGCRVNQAEAFAWANMLQGQGLDYRSSFSQCDIVLVNTCTLTSRADRDVRQFLNKLKRVNPDARVVLTGCYSERISGELENELHVWKVIPNAEKDILPDRILATIDRRVNTATKPYRSRALVKIQDGCDFLCSFCIIPHVRGKSVSLPEKKIIQRVMEYTKQGYREIVLTGIHLCSYGNERPEKDSLEGLLRKLGKIEGLGRIRLSSLDPRFLDRKLRDAITRLPFVCPHYHLSLQHGSDVVIRRMGRRIQASVYRRILDDLRQKSPRSALGADIIVGFPGETEADFENMVGFLEKSPLTYFHVFSYSPRPGTPAYHWKQVDEKTKKRRASLLRSLSERKKMEFRQRLIGDVHDGVVIRKKRDSAQILTSNYISVDVPGCKASEREQVRVKISQVEGSRTRGYIVDG